MAEGNVVYVESELSVAANKIKKYCEFLAKAIEQYADTLVAITGDGISDRKICDELKSLSEKIRPGAENLEIYCTNIRRIVGDAIDAVEEAQKLSSSEELFQTVLTLLAAILLG